MRPPRTQVHVLPTERPFPHTFLSGVSLHSHTEHSQERMGALPQHLARMPVVSFFTEREMERYRAENGVRPDFSRAYWRGPLSAKSAHELEARQIEDLGFAAIVSLTDHDNLDAGLELCSGEPVREVPISVEWTVPYERSFVHVGVHNIPANRAAEWMNRMTEYTRAPQLEALGALLEDFESCPEALVVLNHPLWDMGGLGSAGNIQLVKNFLAEYRRYIHALEINGLRSWQENLGAVSLGQESGHLVVSGGDRHGFEPNATINLTRATSFAEFAYEIREERISDIAMMPQYREPLVLRHLLTAWDIVREHPQLVERSLWIARVHVLCPDGIERPLSKVWTEGAPGWIDPCLKIIGLLANPTFRAPFRLAPTAAASVML